MKSRASDAQRGHPAARIRGQSSANSFVTSIAWLIPENLRDDPNAVQRVQVSVASNVIGPPFGYYLAYQVYFDQGQLGLELMGFLLLVSLFLLNPFLYRVTRSYVFPGTLAIVEFLFVILYGAYFYGGGFSFAVVWLAAVPVAAVLLVGQTLGLITAVLGSAGAHLLFHLEASAYPFPTLVAASDLPALNIQIAICAILYVSFLSGAHEWINQRSRSSLREEIWERRLAEESLFEEKERAQVTLESIGDAVLTTDAQGIVRYLNPVAEALTGWSEGDAPGERLSTVLYLVDEQSRTRAPDLVAHCLRGSHRDAQPDHFRLLSRGGQEYVVRASAAPIRDRSGDVLGVVLVLHDVTEARRLGQQMAHQAAHDALTGLVNRHEFEKRLEHALASSRQYGTHHALCYLDLDQFKIVNDTAGHIAGDELLKQLAGLLLDEVRARDTLARIGGDEFGLLLDNCRLDKAEEIAQALVASVRAYRFVWKEHVFQVGVSIGVAPITAFAEDTVELLTQADVACYAAKDLGRGRVHVYQSGNGEPSRRHTEILRVAELRDALEQERFRLYCQPIVPLRPGGDEADRYELLLRLLDTQGQLLLPGAFIPAAERFGLMDAIDRWVIQTALRRYREVFGDQANTGIAINLSGTSLNDAALPQFVREQFASSSLDPRQVCFEISETAAIHNLSQAGGFIAGLKATGCRFALDDFGSGLSSFSYLKKLPVDYLKIDGSIVGNVVDDPADHAIVAAINQIGQTMGIRTIAECVPREALPALRLLGVDYAQGDSLGAPRPLVDMS